MTAFDPSRRPYGPVLDRAHHHARAFLDSLDMRPVAATLSADALRTALGAPLSEAGMDAATVIDELVAAADGGIATSAGARFFAWVIGGALPASVAADWMTTVWDQNAGMYACSPAAAIVEEVCGDWLKDLLGLPSQASFALVTGCQMAHATCLAAARHCLLERRGWDVERDGLSGAPRIRVVTSSEKHSSIDRALRLLGMGSGCVEALSCDVDGRLSPQASKAALSESDAPAIVVLQAGDLNIGAFDDFAALIPIARAAGAWVHVDGAFGLWCAASPSRRHLLQGVEGADSWATDAHKWLNAPYDSGIAFVADPASHRAALTQRASYLVDEGLAREQIDWNPEFSRRARGFPIYAALRELGRAGVAEMIDRDCDCCAALVERIGALPGAQALSEPRINQGLVRFLDTAGDHDRRTDEVIAAINATGEAFFSPVTWRGMRAMRISVTNWRTNGADVDRVVEAVARVLSPIKLRSSRRKPGPRV